MFESINTSCPWPVPSAQPHLAPGVVHVWRLALDLPEPAITGLRALLPADEEARAARYLFDKHRRRFIACRGQVRRILAAYLNADAIEISFRHGARGKPALAAPWMDSQIQFNVSNSHELALCAVCLDRDLGVDVEYVQRPTEIDGLAERFFAPREVDTLRSLPDDQRIRAFFHCWTRKEAVLKAVGIGLGMPLNQVEVTLAPFDPADVLVFADAALTCDPWWLHSLDPAPDYIGALASRGTPLEVMCWRLA
ncbi:MAG TPA: 4'-phosphopantetheinyl transferase superfamily protein [Planctomycetaceae bacterium]|jgi:4'-phosphopantetheinyl transferase